MFNTNEMAELKGQIVDIFEDWIDENNYFIENDDREDAIVSGEYDDPSEAAQIYADDYGYITDEVEYVINNHAQDELTADKIAIIIRAFEDICKRNDIELSDETKAFFASKIKTTFINWGLPVK